MGSLAAWLLSLHFSIFGIEINLGDLSGSIEHLLSFTTLQSLQADYNPVAGLAGMSGIQGILYYVSGSFKAIAFQLLFLMSLIHLIKLAMDPERLSWSQVFMVIVRFFIFKFLIEYSLDFFTILFQIGDNLLSSIHTFFGLSQNQAQLFQSVQEGIDSAEWGISIFGVSLGPLIAFICFLMFYLPMMGTYIALIAQIFTRMFKILAMICFAPVPMALSAFDEGALSRRMIFSAVAAVLEGLYILLMVKLYQMGISSLVVVNEGNFVFLGQMLAILVLNSILSLSISQAAQYAERWIG